MLKIHPESRTQVWQIMARRNASQDAKSLAMLQAQLDGKS